MSQHKTMFRSIRSAARIPLKRHTMQNRILTQPFEISNEVHINDRYGAVCTADSPAIAQTLLALLNRTMVPMTYEEKPELTAERVLNWIELALLRERDNEEKRDRHSNTFRVLSNICDHLIEFRMEFNKHG